MRPVLDAYTKRREFIAYAITLSPIFRRARRTSTLKQRFHFRREIIGRRRLECLVPLKHAEDGIHRIERGQLSERIASGVFSNRHVERCNRARDIQIVRKRLLELDQRALEWTRSAARRACGKRTPRRRPTINHALAIAKPLQREVRIRAVMRSNQLKPQRCGRHTLRKQIACREEVALRLRHLLTFNLQMPRVKPHACERGSTTRAATLRDLAFVVRENVVLTARVKIDFVAKQHARHRAALKVPARISLAPRARPPHQMRWIRLPQHEVGGMALDRLMLRADTTAFTLAEFVERVS